MKTMAIFLAAILTTALAGCEWQGPPPRYEIVSAPDGKLFRLDTKGGAVHLITPESVTFLSESTPELQVGRYYKMADAKGGNPQYLKYMGDGQFEKFAVLRASD